MWLPVGQTPLPAPLTLLIIIMFVVSLVLLLTNFIWSLLYWAFITFMDMSELSSITIFLTINPNMQKQTTTELLIVLRPLSSAHSWWPWCQVCLHGHSVDRKTLMFWIYMSTCNNLFFLLLLLFRANKIFSLSIDHYFFWASKSHLNNEFNPSSGIMLGFLCSSKCPQVNKLLPIQSYILAALVKHLQNAVLGPQLVLTS